MTNKTNTTLSKQFQIPIKKILVTGNIDFPNTHIPDGSRFCFST